MYDLSCKIYTRLVHIFCDIYNWIISAEEEEQIQLVKKNKWYKTDKESLYLRIKGCF